MGPLNTFERGQSTRSTRRSRHRGVSLLEVVIALAVLGFGMLGAAAAQISAFRNTDESQERMIAQSLAQQQVERFREMSRTSLETILAAGSPASDPLNPIDPDPADAKAMAFNRTWTITPDTPEDNVYTIVVNVSWTSAKGGTQSVQLETFVSEI
jgi:type IV pilus assembly protein PilV